MQKEGAGWEWTRKGVGRVDCGPGWVLARLGMGQVGCAERRGRLGVDKEGCGPS